MPVRRLALIASLLLLAASPAAAQDLLDSPLLQLRLLSSGASAKPWVHGSEIEDATGLARLPRIGLHAGGRLLDRLGVFAGGRGFTVRRHGTQYDVEGGASLQLLDRVSLTGSYRLMGYELKQGTAELLDEVAGPFIGLMLRY